ncbi:MAG: septum formation initiator family protein [Clostridia bacterium]|nr:septum formation initiator family protein [Clostridia bacterium]MBQ7751771.1 septum formation initiator family protein [Clostridia bacterium]
MPYNNNLAYDLDFEANAAKIEKKVKEQQRQNKAKAKAQRAKIRRTIICCLGIFAIFAGFMISRNVTAYESKRNVAKLQKELNSLKEYSSQKAFELDKSIDREEIEREARTRLNMVRPEKYQTVYVNVKQDDVTEVTVGEAEGIKSFFGIFQGK